MAEQDIDLLNYKQLKERCVSEGISVQGNRRQLLFSLRAQLQNGSKVAVPRRKSRNRDNANRSRRFPTKMKRSQTAAVLSYYKPLPRLQSREQTPTITTFDAVIPLPINQNDEDTEQTFLSPLKPVSLKNSISVPLRSRAIPHAISMKKLYWNPIRSQLIHGSIWENLREDRVDFNTKHFELHFQVRPRKLVHCKPIIERKHNKCNLQKAKILSKKRYKDIESTLNELEIENMSQLRQALLDMDEIALNDNKITGLMSIIPNSEEQKKVHDVLDGNGGDLVCRFMYALSDFYHLERRLKTWLFKLHFAEIRDSIQEQYDVMHDAAQKLTENQNLRTLLSIILSFGNYMNKDTQKEDILGFDISVLTRIKSMVSFDNTHTLLMYIYSFCDKQHADALQIVPELKDTLKAAVSIEIQMLNKAHQLLMDQMEAISVLIHSDEIENYDPNDRFISVLSAFYKEAKHKLDTLNMEIKNTKLAMKYCMMFYRYGSQSNPKCIDSFYGIWWKFLIDFAASKDKLVKLERDRFLRMEKRKKQKHIHKQRMLHKQYSNPDIKIDMKEIHEEKEDEKEDSIDIDMTIMTSPIGKEIQRRTSFQRHTRILHDKLKNIVQMKSYFVQSEGVLPANVKQNVTMRRVSASYQQQVKSDTNVHKIFAYDRFMEETRKKMAILEEESKPLMPLSLVTIASRSNSGYRSGSHSPIALKQSESNIFAENEEMEDWHKKYNEIKAQKEVFEGQNNTLVQQLNKMQKLNEDLLDMYMNGKSEENKGLKQHLMFLNKELHKFSDMHNDEIKKITKQKVNVEKELNELKATLKAFQNTLSHLSLH